MKQKFYKYFKKIKNPLKFRKIKGFLTGINFSQYKSKTDYSYFQKTVSFVIIFFLLFNITLSVPFRQYFNYKVNADNKEFFNLVSVIVDDDIYSDVKSSLTRYARDIEKVLDNTKVVLVPTPKDASSFQVASLLESLYFEGYKSVNNSVKYESKLVGSLFVGDIPLPIVKMGENYSKTILPYTDFEEKIYVYNHKTSNYEESENASSEIKPEIWHGVVSPNTGNKNDNIDAINDYFDKNHDYYLGKGLFDKDLGVTNGNIDDDDIDGYEPYVFYFDQFREEQSINYSNYIGYQKRQENLEDLVYNRYSKELATKLKDQIMSGQGEDIETLIKQVFPDITLTGSTASGSMFDGSSDISTRYVTNKLVKRFIEIFNSSALAEMRQNVFNAGRYSNPYDKTNVDLTPFLISVIDLITEEVVKNANDDLEKSIDDLVKGGLSRKIPVWDNYTTTESCGKTYTNYFYGKKGSDIKDASECSIYRGSLTNSGILVEANRGLNINNIQSDSSVISKCSVASFNKCGSNMSCITKGWWGGNSPINLNMGEGSTSLKLNTHNINGSIIPLYDTGGAKRESDINKTNTPLDCFLGVGFITNEKTPSWSDGFSCDETYNINSKIGWNCNTDNLEKGTLDYNDFYYTFNNRIASNYCESNSLYLDGKVVKSNFGWFDDTCNIVTKNYYYKTIPSYIFHKSPLQEDLKSQINSMVTPALPIDKDRYVDFIGADGNYKKINYPYLYRLNLGSGSKNTFENIEKLLESELDKKSLEINNLIDNSKASAKDTIYSKYLKNGAYPSSDMDLLKNLKDKPLKVYTLDGNSKNIAYYDTLVFALYWKNLNSISAKYKFVFENYLSDQFSGNSYKFGLPESKKMYEISYMGAPGDAQNMYVKIDPESKNTNPYANIMSNNATLNNTLLGMNAGEGTDKKKLFKCGPPDGVPIWQWIPAVICRLKTMMPPTIKIGAGECGNKSLFLSEDEQKEIEKCDGDIDKNGINDCLESELGSGSLQLISDASRYYYNKTGKLNVKLLDAGGNQVKYDNSTIVTFNLDRLESINSEGNNVLVFQNGVSNENARKDANNYFNFKDSFAKVSAGEVNYSFSTKPKDVDAYIKATINLVDFKKQSQVFLEKTIKIEVRGDNFIASAYNINSENGSVNIDSGSNGVIASDVANIFLLDGKINTINTFKNTINNVSNSKEKLIFVLENYSKAGSKLPINYPLIYDVYDSNGISYSSGTINSIQNFNALNPLSKTGDYTFEIKDNFGFKFKKNFVVKPETVNNAEITLGTTILETGDVVTTHFLSIFDKYKNIVTGEFFTIEGSLSGDGLVFEENSKDSITYQTVEGYKIFRLKSTNDTDANQIKFDIKDSLGKSVAIATKDIKTLSNISLVLTPLQSEIKVGGKEYSYNFSVKDNNGNIINDFNSRLYLTMNSIYGTPKESYVDVLNGKGTVKFFTKKTASKDVKLSFQIEGLKNIYTKYVDILPDDPIRIDLAFTKDKIEASETSSTILKAELKDRFGNLVYNDSKTKLEIELKDQYKNIIVPDKYSSTTGSGLTNFKINATDIPGIAYIKVKANPAFKTTIEIEGQAPFLKSTLKAPFVDTKGLTETGKKFFEEYNIDYYRSKYYSLKDLNNSLDFKALSKTNRDNLAKLWISTNKITINPQGENAIKMETFYFWNKKAIHGNSYNSLYTVLLGAPYGDITKENYLASSLLFDKNNRNLSVTSLLNDPYKYSDVISIDKAGAFSSIQDSKNITQDIKYIADVDKNGKLYFDMYNDALSVYIGKIYYNLDKNNKTNICTSDTMDFLDCNIDKSNTSILLKDVGTSYNAYEEGNSLVLKNNFGNVVFSIDEDGKIEKKLNLTIENYSLNSTKNAVFAIKEGTEIVGLFSYNLVDSTLNITRDETLLNTKLTTLKNSIIVYLNSYLYGDRIIDTGENEVLMIYYNDPFDSVNTLDNFSESNPASFENFQNEKTVGWAENNKSLLLFAGGESVGESTKKYASFSMINLGDPVVSLKNKKKKLPGTTIDRSFDATVGKLISKDNKTKSYKIFDYNGDNLDDIVLIKTDGFIELLENKGGNNFISKGNLIYLPEIGSNGIVETGNFAGDIYEDIFFVSKGKPYLLNNIEKKFTKISLEKDFALTGDILRASSFDMDNDSIKDIVTLDTSGEINVFYGTNSSISPKFTNKKVGDGYVLKLDSTPKNANGAIYYNGLPTFDKDKNLEEMVLSNEDLVAAMATSGAGANNTFDLDERMVDNILYINLPYSTGALNVVPSTGSNMSHSIIDDLNIPIPNNEELGDYGEETKDGLSDLINYSSDNMYYYPSDDNEISTTFVKSEYSSHFGMKLEKIFTDKNGGSLNGGDKINVEIKIKNISNKTKKDIAYAEKIENYFSHDSMENSLATDKLGTNVRYNVGDYNFIVDNFSLSPGQSITINYEVESLPLTFGYIETGLFEKGEVGDDNYGDIMLKSDEKSCLMEVDLYRSTGPRFYDKGKTKTTCDVGKLKLPGDLELNKIDTNNNGVPDYIDNLAKSASSKDTAEIKKYSDDALADMLEDKDKDGIPDDEDSTPSYNNNDKSTGNFLDTINDTTDEILDGLDFISEGLCKGFGGGSCISSPLNAAPLAPGSSLTLFGFPIAPAGISQIGVVNSGLPIFSALTGLQMMCGPSPCCIPAVWPVTPLAYIPGPACGIPSAGGILGTWAPTNTFRLFVTPTITGAVGVAACFGGPASVMGYAPFFPGLSPIVPGGNCVVAAAPLLGCKGDGSDGDPRQKNNAINFGNYDIVNGSCLNNSNNSKGYFKFDDKFVESYLKYKSGDKSTGVLGAIKDSFKSIATPSKTQTANLPANPIISIGAGNDPGMGEFSIDIDTTALKNGNLKDVIKIKNTWITDFPAFLMDWVDRQIEEIVTKLTSFPSIIVILPDFNGVFDDSWSTFFDDVKSSFKEGKQKGVAEDKNVQTQIDTVTKEQEKQKCSEKSPGDDGYFDCMSLSLKSTNLGLQKDYNPTQTISGIKAVYEFIGNLPLISIQEQTVNVNIPWITDTSLLKAKLDFEMTKKQWEDEIERAKNAWSFGQACNQSDIKEKDTCEKENSIKEKIILDANGLINSFDKNIEAIENYKKFPEDLLSLLNKKEERLEQVLCNIDTITTLFGGWLGANGERFKAWVQTYILIKAVLKSWQLLIDLFVDYETSCKECKNERNDLMTFIWKLISMIIPKIPVIQFPKWPNIVIDLHNIKAGLIIALPDFKFNVRPIVLPTLPKLYLPNVPSLKISLPTIPILPSLELPTLPDLPTLPKIELPDLPPPPKLPKLLGAIEGVLNILKIVTKIMCILKSSPLVPEWRAGDQISFITERQGFLPFDFLDISLPQFSFPFIDAIKITTYVNFELEVDFIVEMAKQTVEPLNTFTNNVVNLFNINIPDLDFRNVIPVDEINIDLGNKSGYIINDTEKSKEIVEKSLGNFSKFIAYSIFTLVKHIDDNKDINVGNKEFLTFVNENLAKESIQGDPKTEELRKLWQDVSNMTYSKEDKFIVELKEKSDARFDTLRSIINTEIQKTKNQKKSIKNIDKPNSIKFVSENSSSDIKGYNELLRKHNLETVKATMNLLEDKGNDKKDLEKDGKELLTRVKTGLGNFSDSLVAATTSSSSSSTSGGTCSSDPNYKFDYKGIYVIENGISYRLFDYIVELKGDEKLGHSDLDNDSDEDLLYIVGGELYLKENTKNTLKKNNTIYNPIELDIGDNKFFNGDIFYEAINNTKESVSKNGYINFSFDAPTRDDLHNFRLEFYSIVDKFLNEDYDLYIPKDIRKEVVDSFESIDDITLQSETGEFEIRKNIAYLTNVGNSVSNDVVFETKELKNIREDIEAGNIVSLSSTTKLYAGNNSFTIEYYIDDPSIILEKTINSNEQIEFKSGAKVVGLNGNAYVEGNNNIKLTGQNIKTYVGLPLLPGSYIKSENDDLSKLNSSSNFSIKYYDGTEVDFDLSEVKSYRLYDLGFKTDSYLISLKQENDFYYSKINSFKENIFGTKSSQVLLAPQLSSDKSAPEINVDGNIKIPVYKKTTYDFTQYIYEDSGLAGIGDFYIDFDLDIDSDSDGDEKNDRDTDKIDVKKTLNSVKVDFGPYDELFTKKIGLHIEDLAGNYAYKEAVIEVYAPIPSISNVEGENIYGAINEKISGEPVNVYRYRGGGLSKIIDKTDNQKVNTTNSGTYIFDAKFTNEEGLDVIYNGVEVASVNEKTGLITINNLAGPSIKVIPSNDSSNDVIYPKIVLQSNAFDIYYQYFSFDNNSSINVVNDFSNVSNKGIYLKIDDNTYYSYYQIPLTASYNPGAIVIHSISDPNKTPLFIIFSDGRINTYSNYYKLNYKSLGDNVVFEMYDNNRNKTVGELLFEMNNGNYIMK